MTDEPDTTDDDPMLALAEKVHGLTSTYWRHDQYAFQADRSAGGLRSQLQEAERTRKDAEAARDRARTELAELLGDRVTEYLGDNDS